MLCPVVILHIGEEEGGGSNVLTSGVSGITRQECSSSWGWEALFSWTTRGDNGEQCRIKNPFHLPIPPSVNVVPVWKTMVCSIVQTLVCSVVTFHASTPQEWLLLRWVEVLLLVRTRVSSAKSPFPLSAHQSRPRHQYQRNCHHNCHYLHCCLYLC